MKAVRASERNASRPACASNPVHTVVQQSAQGSGRTKPAFAQTRQNRAHSTGCVRQNLAGHNNGDAVLGSEPAQKGWLDFLAFSLEYFASLLHKGRAKILVVPLLVLGLPFLSIHNPRSGHSGNQLGRWNSSMWAP